MTTPPRHQAKKRVYRNRRIAIAVVVVYLAAMIALTVNGFSGSGTTTTTSTVVTTTSTSTTTSLPATTTSSPHTSTTVPVTTTTSAQGLAQTDGEPPSSDSALTSRLQPLWRAIVSGSLATASPLFFPEPVYVSMKTGIVPDPASDYADRLVAFYDMDLGAYHAALGRVRTVTLIGVDATPGDAAWISPGVCENHFGYWHLPGVRFVYRLNGSVHSFAIASLISWRGVWYVVHLGPNPRPVNVGTVDLPARGAGVPGPAGGC